MNLFTRLKSRARAGRERRHLKRAARGSERDLEQLYEEHVENLYAFVFYRVGRDGPLAEDVVQETFTKALDNLQQYDPQRGSLQAWLRTLSRNAIRDQLRTHRRGDELAQRWEQLDQTLAQIFAALDEQPLSDEVLGREETRELVNATVASLPEHYRNALEHKYIGGDTMEELAIRLTLSREATKSLLQRARRSFREAFAALSRSLAEVK